MNDDFNWADADVEGDVCVPRQQTIAVYCNPKNNVVIRQEAQFHPDEDHWVIVDARNALSLARAILDKAGLDDLAIVHVSQLRIQNGGGELLQPFPDQRTIDAVRNAGRAADLDDDQDEEPEPKGAKDRTARERQRRRRQKQRDRDGVTDELDFQGGQQERTH